MVFIKRYLSSQDTVLDFNNKVGRFLSKFTVFPNPVLDRLLISINVTFYIVVSKIIIYDELGRKVDKHFEQEFIP